MSTDFWKSSPEELYDVPTKPHRGIFKPADQPIAPAWLPASKATRKKRNSPLVSVNFRKGPGQQSILKKRTRGRSVGYSPRVRKRQKNKHDFAYQHSPMDVDSPQLGKRKQSLFRRTRSFSVNKRYKRNSAH